MKKCNYAYSNNSIAYARCMRNFNSEMFLEDLQTIFETEEHNLLQNDLFFYFIYFNLYIYPPDSQESDGGAIHRVGNYPDLLPEMPRYCCPLVI